MRTSLFLLTQVSAGDACNLPCGVSPLTCSANGRYYIAQHYSAAGYFAAICFCPLHPPRRRCAQIESACGEMNSPCDVIILKLTQISAGMPCGRIPRKCVIALHSLLREQRACRRCRIPRTGVITLHNTIPRSVILPRLFYPLHPPRRKYAQIGVCCAKTRFLRAPLN